MMQWDAERPALCTTLKNRQAESTGNINTAYFYFLVNTTILSNVMSLQAII